MRAFQPDDLLRAVERAIPSEWTTVPTIHALVEGLHGLGVQDVAWALRALRRDGWVERRAVGEIGHVWRRRIG